MFIVYELAEGSRFPTIEGIFKIEKNAMEFAKYKKTVTKGEILISRVVDDSAYEIS